MITRTAIFEGRIKAGYEDHFFKEVGERLVPLWKEFPHAENVRYYRIVASDPDARPIAMLQQIDYHSMKDLEEAVTSPIRNKARAITLELMEMFEGRLYHVVSEESP